MYITTFREKCLQLLGNVNNDNEIRQNVHELPLKEEHIVNVAMPTIKGI